MVKPEEHILFAGRDWVILKAWLLEQKELKINALVRAETHDASNEVRGALKFIQQVLALEPAADRAANQGLTNEYRNTNG